MAHAEYTAFGYFPKGPPSEAAAIDLRNGRAGVAERLLRGYAGTGFGKMQCVWCWRHGVSATSCRLVGKGLRGHPAVLRVAPDPQDSVGGPDFDATLLGKRVAVTAVQNDKRAFAGVVSAFDAASGRHTVTLDNVEAQQHYLFYFPPSRMIVTGACTASPALLARSADRTAQMSRQLSRRRKLRSRSHRTVRARSPQDPLGLL